MERNLPVYRAIDECIPFGIWACGRDGRMLYLSDSFLKLIGMTLDEARGFGWLECLPPEERESILEKWKACIKEGNEWNHELHIRDTYGIYHPVLSRGTPVNPFGGAEICSGGEPVGWVGINLDITERKQAQEALQRNQRWLAFAKGEEEERKRLARELHDNFGQRLALLEMRLDKLAQAPPPPDELPVRFQPLKTEIGSLNEEIRSLSHHLHPATLEELGLQATLESECEQYSSVHGIAVQCRVEVPDDLPDELALALYRIVQLSLHNVTKHAKASKVTIEMAVYAGDLFLHIEDDGIGYDPSQTKAGGLGLLSMEERLSSLGGSVSIQTRPGEGTTIDVAVPLPSE